MKVLVKILKWVGIVFGIITLLGIFAGIVSDDKNKTAVDTESIEKPFNMDSLITVIKKDKSFDIKEVYYNSKDSSLNIAITNKDKVIDKHDYSAKYFNTMFYLDSVPKIEGVYLYEFKEGKSFDKKSYLDGFGQRFGRYVAKFEKRNMSSWDGSCRPVERFLKENLKDPSSLEIDKTWNLGMNRDSTFTIKTTYRAKNSFNALVLETITCNVDMNGNISNIKQN